MTAVEIYTLIGFILAAYAIVANDAIQTLGTFLSSNAHRPWWVLWLFACTVLTAVMAYGWFANNGDVTYGRLSKFPEPAQGLSWIHAVPPLFILVLTRFGVPVSTTFLVLTVFAPGNLESMLTKSLLGYALALVVGGVVYRLVTATLEGHFLKTAEQKPAAYWVGLQWASTAFLWSQWLIQDLANIFVYLPRPLNLPMLVAATVLMLVLHAVIFKRRGGEIQRIVTSKTNTTDIRSATIIDFIYALVLLFFKEWSNIPMSTTWVFLGLLAGREFAISHFHQIRPLRETARIAVLDAAKAAAGLLVSVGLAFGLPVAQRWVEGDGAAAPVVSDTQDVRPEPQRAAAGTPRAP